MSKKNLSLSAEEYREFLGFVSSNRDLIVEHYPEYDRDDVDNAMIANLFLVQDIDVLHKEVAYMFRLEQFHYRFPELVRTFISEMIGRKKQV